MVSTVKQVRIARHPKHHYEIHRFCQRANEAQKEMCFSHPRLTAADEKWLARKKVTAEEALQRAFQIKQRCGLGEGDLFVLTLDGNVIDGDDDEYLTYSPAWRGLEARFPGVALVSMHYTQPQSAFMKEGGEEWFRKHSESELKTILSNVLDILLLAIVTEELTGVHEHEETRGCVLDWCQHPSDVLEATLRGAQFDGVCAQRICSRDEGVGQALLDVAASLDLRCRAAVPAMVFVSYARKDEETVRGIYDRLRQEGFTPWLDKEDIRPGEPWDEAIRRAIQDAHFFLACLSPNSVGREGVLRREFEMACQIWEDRDRSSPARIFPIPARIAKCDVPESHTLSKFQIVDLYGPNSEWDRLLRTIREEMERRRK
jgi:hypothetical protein